MVFPRGREGGGAGRRGVHGSSVLCWVSLARCAWQQLSHVQTVAWADEGWLVLRFW